MDCRDRHLQHLLPKIVRGSKKSVSFGSTRVSLVVFRSSSAIRSVQYQRKLRLHGFGSVVK